MASQKNVLIIDDSALMRRLLSDIINSDKRFTVADMVTNGLEALDIVTLNSRKYDVIILDINMPKMSGIQFLERMEKFKIKLKVVVVSTLAKEGAKETIRCLELGAFDFVTKPESYADSKSDAFRERILSVISAAVGFSGDNVVKPEEPKKNMTVSERIGYSTAKALYDIVTSPAKRNEHKRISNGSKLIALACSTGGPKALQQVIPKIPKNIDAPFLLVQHMPAGFTASLAARLNEMSEVNVKEAADGDILEKGTVYIARGGKQLRVAKKGSQYQIVETDEPARGGLKPCADIMYESLTETDFDDITCVVLTGMGGDGTLGIKQLNEKKNIYVIAQNEETCTVYGMPKVVAEAGLTDEIVPLNDIAEAITKNVGVR